MTVGIESFSDLRTGPAFAVARRLLLPLAPPSGR